MLVALYPTKKALKESIGKGLIYQETSLFGNEFQADGTLYVVGPSATKRKWYAQIKMTKGLIEKVK